MENYVDAAFVRYRDQEESLLREFSKIVCIIIYLRVNLHVKTNGGEKCVMNILQLMKNQHAVSKVYNYCAEHHPAAVDFGVIKQTFSSFDLPKQIWSLLHET